VKIVNPSAEILDHLDQQSLATRIEECGRICYKSEDRISQESALPFVAKVAEHGHNSVLEMGVVTLEVHAEESAINELFLCQPKYLHISLEGNRLLITGSIRAFREMLMFHPTCAIVRAACACLNERHPYFFSTILPEGGLASVPSITARKVPLEDIDQLPADKLVKHRNIAVKFIVNRAVTHELVRHRVSSFLQECLTGDTVVKSFNGHKSWSMKELHRMFHDKRCGLARSAIRIRVKDKEGEIVPSRILNVFESGEKEVFLVKTRNGKSIKSSIDHIYFTEIGERRLEDIKVGDKVWMNGRAIHVAWLREEYLVKNRMRKDIADEIGMSDAWLGKKIREFGLQKPKPMYPGRKPGYGVKGMFSDEDKSHISQRMRGSGNHKWVGDEVTAGGARSRLHRHDNARRHVCVCGSVAMEMHHIDRNPLNNNHENIEYCCLNCHRARHKEGVTIAWLDEIVSIEPCGKEMTYDLEVEHSAHNFVANGFIVHNSQRYCRYSDDKFGSEVTFIKPMFWAEDSEEYAIWQQAMAETEQLYLRLLETSTAQAARTVLPNSCKTEIIVYANLEQWRHIFKLRCSKAAEPSMREVMIPLSEEFTKRWPGVFENE
jgi:thymidylate synthase ThyX